MEFESRYQAKAADQHGFVEYSAQEHETWGKLYQRQIKTLPDRACSEHLEGLKLLSLNQHKIPQLPEVNAQLKALTGWSVTPVKALISHKEFFELLANRVFPAATFIRKPEELDYLKEPDIFHEIFGHAPMLTHNDFADFVQKYAETVLNMPEEDWPLMQRLFWFTVEFGLIQTSKGIRAYGGGILSSIGETVYSVESPLPLRIVYQPLAVFRTPYRIDIMQPVYFVIQNYKELYQFLEQDIALLLKHSRALGEFPPLFEIDENNPGLHYQIC